LFAGLSAEAQKAIDNMSADELVQVIYFDKQKKMPIAGILGLEDLPSNNNYVFRWRFALQQPLVSQNWSTSSQLRCADFTTGT
jgi:hypothetical protein